MFATSFDEQIDGSAGFRSAVNIVAKENMDRPHRADRREVSIDYDEHLLKQVGAAVNISDRVDTNSVRQPRLSCFGF